MVLTEVWAESLGRLHPAPEWSDYHPTSACQRPRLSVAGANGPIDAAMLTHTLAAATSAAT
jgi:hypothetical protein